ncbi:hypothetical protein [Microvirga brassicacearum]|uniref:Antifreeze protein n=1 Tax=Microvirga brassicacearum TaxID=2580413 RepID=A0A5N3P8Z4_9HYPH|nr:hypothetical protein [Microvirga brassicacearum]KAB0266193.1 hypothetical protein FEZ63_15665 [Microvirga brassicacearum]
MLAIWMKLATDLSLLAMESHAVVVTRMTMLATGRGSAAENTRMISEKVLAATEAAITMASGGSPAKVVSGYRKHVRANARRLNRG